MKTSSRQWIINLYKKKFLHDKLTSLFDKSIIMTNLALFTLKLLPLYIPISLLYTEHFCLT